jgi:ferredoxin-NADP reductase
MHSLTFLSYKKGKEVLELAKNKVVFQLNFKEMIKETSDVYSFVFTIPEELDWIPGQHGIFRFTDKNIEGKDFRIFSFASIKEENIMLFTTRIVDEPSDFKKHLLTLKTGDIMTVDGAIGKFKIDDYSKTICIMAGGIGITPIRAFLKDLDSRAINPKLLKVLYSDDRGEFAYEEFLKEVNEKHSGLDIEFISDRNIFSYKIDEFAKEKSNDSLYYIAGTPGMNAFITEKLLGLGIEKDFIKTDVFLGYE